MNKFVKGEKENMQWYIQIEGGALVCIQRIYTIQEMNTLNKTLYETSKKKL